MNEGKKWEVIKDSGKEIKWDEDRRDRVKKRWKEKEGLKEKRRKETEN